MKILVLVGSSHGTPYDQFIENWKLAKLPKDFKLYFYFLTEGIDRTEIRNGNEIHIPGIECPIKSFAKTIEAYRYALAHEEFDVLLRPCLSSAFHFERLRAWLSKRPTKNHGFGKVVFNDFLSGCGYALTRDVVQRFVDWTPTEPDGLDDVMLGKFMRQGYIDVNEWHLEFDRPVNADIYNDPNFHLRFKTSQSLKDRIPDTVNHRKTIEYWNTTP
jgi:hypothetical protein